MGAYRSLMVSPLRNEADFATVVPVDFGSMLLVALLGCDAEAVDEVLGVRSALVFFAPENLGPEDGSAAGEGVGLLLGQLPFL